MANAAKRIQQPSELKQYEFGITPNGDVYVGVAQGRQVKLSGGGGLGSSTVLPGAPGKDGSNGADAVTTQSAQTDANVSAGQAVYVKNTGHVGLAQANALSTAQVAGIATAAASATFAATFADTWGVTLTDWTASTGSSTLTLGATYYLDPATAGGLTTTAPTTSGQAVTRVGVALTTLTLLLDIQAPIGL